MIASNKTRIAFIINPKSGSKKLQGFNSILNNLIDEKLFEYVPVYTSGPKEATKLSADFVEKGFQVVTAVGGDGTVNEVSKPLIGTDVKLGIIPCGSGNGLANHLGIPPDPGKALKKILSGNSTLIDTGFVNHHTFVSVAGFGFDALVGHKFAKTKQRGLIGYIRIILKEFMKYNRHAYRMNANGQELKIKAFLFTVANTNQFGNNAKIAPGAEVDDGFLDLVAVRKVTLITAIPLVYKLFNASLKDSHNILRIRIQDLKLELETENFMGHVDGEAIEVGRIINIGVKPSSLHVII